MSKASVLAQVCHCCVSFKVPHEYPVQYSTVRDVIRSFGCFNFFMLGRKLERPDQTLRRKGSHWLKQSQFMSLSNLLGDAIGHCKLENPRLGFLSSEGLSNALDIEQTPSPSAARRVRACACRDSA